MIDYESINSPCYVIEERRLRNNLAKIKEVQDAAGVKIIMALKAFAMYTVFPIIKEYIEETTASSLGEAALAYKHMGTLVHTYAPVYKDNEFGEIMNLSSHITFNSISHYRHFKDKLSESKHKISAGLRINPEYSDVETDLYNPCGFGSRLGVTAENMGGELPEGIEGLHFHTLCESDSYSLEKTIENVENKFGTFLDQIKWINMGGGHLITRKDYNTEHLIRTLKEFKSRHKNLEVILEPGAAFAWQTGELVTTALDIVENNGIKTIMIDSSFACHMPDCLEMPYKPAIIGATEPQEGKPTYRIGGNSCLSGDFCGDWSFDHEVQVGDKIIFLDMIHYTMVKTTMFNGVSHPSFGIWTMNDKFKLIKEFTPHDYEIRMG